MTLKLLLPELGSKDVSVKDAIISILVRGKPLSAKSIHRELVKNWGLNVSYQGVHKAINSLIDGSVLLKSGNTYSLNKNWISKLKDFINKVDTSYGESTEIAIPKDGEIVQRHYTSQRFYPVELAKFFNKDEVNKTKKPKIAIMLHMQWPLDFSFQDFILLRGLAKRQGGFVICKGDAPLDKWVADQYRKAGLKVKTGIKIDLKGDVFVSDDYIIEGKLSKETIKLYDEVYAKISDLVDLFKHYVKEKLIKSKVDITVTVTKNANLGDLLRNQVTAYFKGEK